MCERGIDVTGFGSDFELLVVRHTLDRAQVVEAVGHFDEYDAYVEQHGFQHLAEVFGLRAFFVVQSVEFGQSVYDACDEITKLFFDVDGFHRSIFHHVVQQGANNSGGTQPDFLHTNARHLDGVHDVWLAGFAALAVVRFCRQFECGADILAVFLVQVGLDGFQQIAVCALNQHFVFVRTRNDCIEIFETCYLVCRCLCGIIHRILYNRNCIYLLHNALLVI